MDDWTAQKLKDSLCRQLRTEHYFAVCEASLGRGRVDVLALRKTFKSLRPVCYEIKISRGDFLQDIRAEKWRKYQPYGQVAFAVPEGLVKKEEIPKEAGLRVRFSSGWRWIKRGASAEPTGVLRDEFFLRMLLSLGDQAFERGRQDGGWRKFSEYDAARRARSDFARKVMENMTQAEWLEGEVARLEDRRERALTETYKAEARAFEAERLAHPHRVRTA